MHAQHTVKDCDMKRQEQKSPGVVCNSKVKFKFDKMTKIKTGLHCWLS